MKEFVFSKDEKELKDEFKNYIGELETANYIEFTLIIGTDVNYRQVTKTMETLSNIVFEYSDNNKENIVDCNFNTIYIKNTTTDAGKLFVTLKKTIKEPDKKAINLLNATNRAFEILKDFRIFDVGKYDDEIKEICSLYKNEDEFYIHRYDLYERLMKEPKFIKFSEKEKIIFAMQMGALDIHEITNKENKSDESKIVLVDDSKDITDCLSTLLKAEGYLNINVFNTPKEAFDYLKDSKADLIIADVMMQEINGLDFFEKVNELYPKVCKILLGTYISTENLARAINEIGIYKYIEKPWANSMLMSCIEQGIEQYREE